MLAIAIVLVAATAAYAQLPTNCGKPVIQPDLDSQKIVGGREAVPNSWPWQISLRYSGSHTCGASIIHGNYSITAAHCTYGRSASGFSLRAGRHTETGAAPNEQVGTPQRMWQHENYNPDTVNNDITLFRTNTFTFNNFVQPVCLATTEIADSGTSMYATGWGAVQGSCCEGKLKQAMLPYLNRTDCRKIYGSSILSTNICAGKTVGDNVCFGDSGGPLVALVGDAFVQYGISSWVGSYACSLGAPGVFASVPSFVPWILEKISAVEAEEAEVAARGVRPIPVGAAFR